MRVLLNRPNVYICLVVFCALCLLFRNRGERSLSNEEFYDQLAVSLNYTPRDTFCQEAKDGRECFFIVDSLDGSPENWHVLRQIRLSKLPGAYLSETDLISPKELLPSNLNTSKWEVRRDQLREQSYMTEYLQGMFYSQALPMRKDVRARILQIGLGGGQTNNYIGAVFPNIDLTIVDISAMMKRLATKWFGLRESPKQRVIIADGVKFVENQAKQGEKYDVIIVDACVNNDEDPLICPIPQFVDKKTLIDMRTLLGDRGVVLWNLLIIPTEQMPDAGKSMTKRILAASKKVFKNCVVESVGDMTLNQVLICTMKELPPNMADLKGEVEDFMRTASLQLRSAFN